MQRFGSSSSLFDRQAAKYAEFRPRYPDDLYDRVFKFAGLPQRQLALDLGCGSGQVAAVLARSFARVVGVDPSEAQLAHAEQLPNIEYVVAPAEHVPQLADGCADLITVAQAFHWMEPRRFYGEARRLLRPHGVLAIWGYGLNYFPPELEAANEVMWRWYEGTLGEYWDSKRKLVENKYRGLEPLACEFGVAERVDMEMERTLALDELLGYLSTWSSYHTYLKANPGVEDPIVAFRQELQQALLEGGADLGCLQVKWPLFGLLCKQPAPALPASSGGDAAGE